MPDLEFFKSMGFEVIEIDAGDTVLCDICNRDYSNSDEKGGLVFSGKAVCPVCEKVVRASICKHNETEFIRAECRPDQTFREFVLEYRA